MLIYILENTVNGKYYVGKTRSNNLHDYLSVKRWGARHGKIKGMPVVAAMAKYGIDKFEARILTTAETDEQLNQLERLWIAVLNARDPKIGYNIAPGGEAVRSGPLSEEHKKKIGLANKGRRPKPYVRTAKHRQQISDRSKGKKASEETRLKISLAGQGRKRGPETCQRISDAIFQHWEKRRAGLCSEAKNI